MLDRGLAASPRRWPAALALVLTLAVALGAVDDAQARRLGGGRPAGLQRPVPAVPHTPTTPAPGAPTQVAPGVAPAVPAAVPAAAAPRRSWAPLLTGLAAGLGLSALAHAFGFGAGMGNVLTLMLALLVGVALWRWAASMRRGPATLATAGAGAPWGAGGTALGVGGAAWGAQSPTRVLEPVPYPSAVAPAAPTRAAPSEPADAKANALPPDFDRAAFERLAKLLFIRMQDANDRGALDDLRKFTSPELYASLRLDLQDRGNDPQQTDVMQLSAAIVETARDGERWVVSVRYQGLIRESLHATAMPFDELWHLVKPVEGPGDWAIAGITPLD